MESFEDCGYCGVQAHCQECGHSPFDCINKLISEQQAKIQTLLAALEKYEACRSFYGDGNHFEIVHTRGEIIEYDIDAGPLYNYYENFVQKDTGELARQTAKDENVLAALKYLRGEE